MYGLKLASATFREYTTKKWNKMGFKPDHSNMDVSIRASMKPEGEEYYKYLLNYVHEILFISLYPK